ncbi:MAG: hypothetical protein MUF06_22965 [Pirellulaceae bacterium]|jgi:hypothetical protein|nr:hypothetical protein [Pirellulaceae bacterium]
MPRSENKRCNRKPRTVRQLRTVIARLPADRPREYPGKLFKTQKEHWLGWLKYYNTEGAYGRRAGMNRDARYAYNHIVEPKMLLWLIPAAGVKPALVRAARAAAKGPKTMMAQSAAVRRVVPWETVEAALWPGE